MGRKNEIEGQLNFLDMLMAGTENLPDESGEAETVKPENEATQMSGNPAVKAQENSYRAGGFKECSNCWCATCEHSTLGGSVPRPLGDNMRPCPACELCVQAGKADICVIGSADEGCRHRAEKEGLV